MVPNSIDYSALVSASIKSTLLQLITKLVDIKYITNASSI